MNHGYDCHLLASMSDTYWATALSTANTSGLSGWLDNPPSPPDSGVREPRRPLTPAGSGSIALPTTREVHLASH